MLPRNIIIDFDAVSKEIFANTKRLPLMKNMIRAIEHADLRAVHYQYNRYVIVSNNFDRGLPLVIKAEECEIKQLVGEGGKRIRTFSRTNNFTKVSFVDSDDYKDLHSELTKYYIRNINKISLKE